MAKDNSRSPKLYLWMVVVGLLTATVFADFYTPLFAGWEAPLVESGLTSAQVYGAKAAILAVLGAASLLLQFSPTTLSRPTFSIASVTSVTTAVAALLTGWFWLLSATAGNPSPFLIALVPSVGWTSIGIIIGLFVGEALKADRKNPHKLEIRIALLGVGSVVMIYAIVTLLDWLPSRLL